MSAMRRNPYYATLLTVGGLALLLALMLVLIVAAETDYASYDREAVGELRAWTYLMVGIAASAFIGALVLAGMRWTPRDGMPAAGADALERMPTD